MQSPVRAPWLVSFKATFFRGLVWSSGSHGAKAQVSQGWFPSEALGRLGARSSPHLELSRSLAGGPSSIINIFSHHSTEEGSPAPFSTFKDSVLKLGHLDNARSLSMPLTPHCCVTTQIHRSQGVEHRCIQAHYSADHNHQNKSPHSTPPTPWSWNEVCHHHAEICGTRAPPSNPRTPSLTMIPG